MYDALNIAALIAGFAAFAFVAHWVTSRYQRFMNAPLESHDPRVVEFFRAWFGFWAGVKFWAWSAVGIAAGAYVGGLWGAVGGLLLAWFLMACSAVSHHPH